MTIVVRGSLQQAGRIPPCDTHLFRTDKPLYSKKTNRIFESFTRVGMFAWPEMHWVHVTVDPADLQLFRFKAEILPENMVNRRN